MKSTKGVIHPDCMRVGKLLETSPTARRVHTVHHTARIALALGIPGRLALDGIVARIEFACGNSACEESVRAGFYLPLAVYHFRHESGSFVERAFSLGIPECEIEREWVDALIAARVGIWSLKSWRKGVAQMRELVSGEEAEVIAADLNFRTNLVEPTRLAMVVRYRGKDYLDSRECALMDRAQGEAAAADARHAAIRAGVTAVSVPLRVEAWRKMITQLSTCRKHGKLA